MAGIGREFGGVFAKTGSEEKNDKLKIVCSTEYKDYVYNELHNIWSLVSLKAPCMEENEEDKRPPVDVVVVIDKSGSMAGEKLKLVKKSLEFFLTQLNDKDRLGLVTYDTDVYLDFGLKLMNKENKADALQKIKSITDGSCTNLSGGLLKGLEQILERKAEGKNEIASVILFTDGLANTGITSSKGIVGSMKTVGAMKKTDPLKRFEGPETFWKAKKDVVQEAETTSTGECCATVYAFGFGADHNPEMLKDISDAGNGMYYYIENEDKILESFGHCLGGIMSTVAQGIQLDIVAEKGVKIKDLHTGRPFEKSDSSVKINMGDLQSEESRDVILELCIEKVNSTYTSTQQVLCIVNCNCFNVVTNELEKISENMTVLRPEKSEIHDESTANVQLNQQRERVQLKTVLNNAREAADRGDFESARNLIEVQKGNIRKRRQVVKTSAACAAPVRDNISSGYDAMEEDLDMYGAQLSDQQAWRSKGRNLHMNLMQQQEQQRSSNVASKQYATKRQKQTGGLAKAFK